jgi:preprotein translocase subunit SecG
MFRLVRIFVPVAALLALTLLFIPDRARGSSGGMQTEVTTGHYLFGQDAVVEKPVEGSLQVYGGNVFVHDAIHGDLVVLFGDVTLSDRGRVSGNIVSVGGRVTGAEGRVGGEVQSLASVEGAAATMTKNAVIISLLFVWLIVAVALTLMSGREIRISSVEIRASAGHCFVVGLVAFTSFLLTAIVCSYLVAYVIGIPLLVALGVFALLAKAYGLVAVFHAVGSVVAGSRSREQLGARKWLRGDVAMVLVGFLILGCLRLIPVLGPIAWSLASIFGVGVALATKFGRREPWFLAWRPAEA